MSNSFRGRKRQKQTAESEKERANGRRISYVNDIRFRNLITAIIHRAIYLLK